MNQDAYNRILNLSREREFQQRTEAYLAEHLSSFVKSGDGVLICLDTHETDNLSGLMERAVAACGGQPILWGEDHRWKTLLRLAFSSRATTIISTPLVLLGLSKLKKANSTPLFIRTVVAAGYPCFPWMMDGIVKGFDCQVWECFSPGIDGIVAGFSCEAGRGVHLREDAYRLDILSEAGERLPVGEMGRWVLSPGESPDLCWGPGDFARVSGTPCPCGCTSPKVVDARSVDVEDKVLAELAQYLLSWTSVLDFTLCRGPYGLELEMITFPGEQLPKLPTCARQVIRPWDPEKDEPFPYTPGRKNTTDFAESH